MAPGDVCHGPRCSLAGPGPAALEYRSCHWPGGSAGSPQCVRPMGCWFFPVPRPPYVCAASWACRLLFTGVPARCVVLRVRRPGPPGSCSPVCPLGVVCCVCGVLGLPAPVHRCARSVCCVACAASWASRLLFTGAPARCVVWRVRRPGPPGSCSPLCPLGVLCCMCGVLGLPAPVHRCARSVCCVACAASWASRLLFTGAPARCVVLRVRCPGPPGSCSPVCPLGVLCCVCGVLGLPAPVHRCTRSVCCAACAASWASRLLSTGVPARCVVLRVRRPGPPGSCSPVCPLGVLCCVCGVLGLPAPVHRCACSVCCVACAASWASRLLFTGAPARCGVLCCVCGVLGLPAPVHRCARSVCCVACAASWASRLLFTGVPARCVVLRVRRPGPPGSCSPVRPLGVVCCAACAASWASRLLFTGVPARCVVLRVRRPGPPGSCPPVCPLAVLCCVCGVLGLPAPVHRCARSVCCVACAVSWASRLLFTGVPARCVVLRVRRPGPPGSCSPMCLLGVLCCVCGVLGLPAPVHRCARSVCCVACAASWASRLLFTGAPARCGVLCCVVRPGTPGSCSPVCPLGVLCCVCGVLGLPAPVHRCARSVCCVACAASWASRLLFTGVPARCVVLRVRRPGPPGSCSPVRPLGVLCCVCGVLGLPAPVHRCARSVCCVACAASWASRLLFTAVPARCVVLRVRGPGPPSSCPPVCPLAVLCCVCGVLGLPAPVHRCARSVCCVACAASWASRLLFTGVPARCVVLRVRRPGPPGSCSPVRPLGVVCCVACAASWASRLLFTGAPARCVVLRVRRPGPPGSCSPMCLLGVLCCVCGVLGLPAPVHRCARSVWCVVLRVRRPGPPGSCSPVCPLGVLCCVCGVLGLPAPVHRCARSPCCVACAASWASRLLFTGVPVRCVVLRVRCLGPPGSCSPVCPLGVLCCVCGVLGLPAPVHRCACSVCCVACAASWASRLLFTGAPARCVVLRVRRPGPPGSCSPVRPLGVVCCVAWCVLGLPAPVHRCARSVCCVACAASWASRLLFTGVPARCVVLRVRCPGPPGSCSPVRPLGVVCCVACAASWASRLLFTGVPARCVVLRVRRPGPPGSCSPACPLGVLCCVCGVLGLPAPVHRCARSVCCVAVWGAAAGRSLVHPDGGYRSRQGLGTLRAHTRPSGRRLFVAGRGWVPSGRALGHPDGGCSLPAGVGYPPGAHSSIRTAAGVRVLALCGRVGRAGLPGALWCASPFPLDALSFCFAWPPPGWGCPPLSCCPCRSSLPWRRALVVFLGLPLPASSCARASFVSPAWPLAAFWWFLPPPPPYLCLGVFVAPAWCLGVVFFFLFFFLPLPQLCAPVVSGFLWFPAPGALGLGAVRCLLCWPSASRLSVRLSLFRAFRLAGACSPSVAAPPPPFCLAVFVAAARCCVPCAPLWCASFAAMLCRVVLVGCCCLLRRALWRCPLPWGPVLCGAAFCGVPPCCVCVVVARGCVLLLAALLCAVCVPGCCAVRCLSSPLCAVSCFAVLVRSRCAVRVVLAVVGAWCCGVPWCGAGSGGPWLSAGGVFRCPCLLAWSVSLWLVWFAVVPCFSVSCSLVLCCRVVLCCCALLSCCGAVGACFALLWAVVLCCVVLLVGCAVFCPVVVAACCGALFLVLCVPCLLRSVRCGALLCWLWCLASLCRVLWRCAVVWCCAVVLCCRFAVLFVFAAARRAAPVSCALLLVPRAVACPCALWCLLGRSAVWWCCSGVSWCLAVLCVVLWCPASCAVSCGAVLPCGAVLVCLLRGCGCTYLKNRRKIS